MTAKTGLYLLIGVSAGIATLVANAVVAAVTSLKGA